MFNKKHSKAEIVVYDPTHGDDNMSDDDRKIILNTEMLAGKGPDIIFSIYNISVRMDMILITPKKAPLVPQSVRAPTQPGSGA